MTATGRLRPRLGRKKHLTDLGGFPEQTAKLATSLHSTDFATTLNAITTKYRKPTGRVSSLRHSDFRQWGFVLLPKLISLYANNDKQAYNCPHFRDIRSMLRSAQVQVRTSTGYSLITFSFIFALKAEYSALRRSPSSVYFGTVLIAFGEYNSFRIINRTLCIAL